MADNMTDLADIFYKDNQLNFALGQPDYPIYPKQIMQFMTEIIDSQNSRLHQYTMDQGLPRLKSILVKLYSHLMPTVNIGDENLFVTTGSSAALYCSIKAQVREPGDRVLILDPSYPYYSRIVRSVGGLSVSVPMLVDPSTGRWLLDTDKVERVMKSEKPCAIIINTPHNPTGRVFSESELLCIANLCKTYNVFAICDEVYEWYVYQPNKHFRFASIPGMFDRCVTIGSLSKWFHVTGWRLGWALTGDTSLVNAIHETHACFCISSSTPIQEATARMIEWEYEKLIVDHSVEKIDHANQLSLSYWTETCHLLSEKHEKIAKILTDFGLKPLPVDSGYYILADCTELSAKLNLQSGTAFVTWLSRQGIQCAPLAMFCANNDDSQRYEHMVRFCFIKSDETLRKLSERLDFIKRTIVSQVSNIQ
ncbi:kynurenine aminotransferase-like [Oppia nitens]|uniref:kynurenine aminotransferase-like n=1 Tax=Oppia nitens TaxID=1686743 RepID=UPI0023DAE2B7|nr:kynurenine aminotransferase-like [Oppia nitens]